LIGAKWWVWLHLDVELLVLVDVGGDGLLCRESLAAAWTGYGFDNVRLHPNDGEMCRLCD
jgi:hypothetical protein